MGFGNILTQVLQQGMGGRSQTSNRLGNTVNNLNRGGGGIEGIFGQVQNMLRQSGVDTSGLSRSAGGMAGKATDFLRQDQAGGLSGAQIGGIGAAAGALLGGGLGGAARGGALAVLGTLALTALRNSQAGGAAADQANDDLTFDHDELQTLVSPDTEKLILKSMISAAKADGQIDADEMKAIIGKISPDDVTEEEKQFVLAEINAPIDINALASEVQNRAQAAEVYAGALLAIKADSDAERAYLQQLSLALGLDAATVIELHGMTGTPT